MTREATIKERQKKLQDAFLEQLKRTPVIEQACQKVGTSTSTVCRWRREDKKWSTLVDVALAEGRLFMSDIAETQLFALIAKQEFKAIQLYLTTHNKRYSKKLELSGSVEHKDAPLTKEQRKLMRRAQQLSTLKLKAYVEKETKKE